MASTTEQSEVQTTTLTDKGPTDKAPTDKPVVILKSTHYHRYISDGLVFLEICTLIASYLTVSPILRNHELLSSKTLALGVLMVVACFAAILVGLTATAMSRTKTPKLALAPNVVRLLVVLLFFGATIGRQHFENTDRQQFPQRFLDILESRSPSQMQSLHKVQQVGECCGVPLSPSTTWNQSLISLSNPWSSWYHYTILHEDYIPEARRLFTLPWSCCVSSGSGSECEHLAFERVSIDTSNRELIVEELVVVEQRLGTMGTSRSKESVFDASCGAVPDRILPNVSMRIFVVSAVFATISLISLITNVLLIWSLQR